MSVTLQTLVSEVAPKQFERIGDINWCPYRQQLQRLLRRREITYRVNFTAREPVWLRLDHSNRGTA